MYVHFDRYLEKKPITSSPVTKSDNISANHLYFHTCQGHVPYCHIPFTLHVYHLAVLSGCRRDGGVVKGDSAGKQVTAVRVGVF